ncbi:MAG: gliding motility-associated C-terminal domain-containing protein, partial [Saprospiraceae bacterium]
GVGMDSILWDGRDGTGAVIPANPNFAFAYDLMVRGGEIHVLLADIENNVGGVTFTRMNGPGSPDGNFYYDHSGISGAVSGGATAGNALPTTTAFTYDNGFGNRNMLDQWAFIETNNFGNGTLAINIEADCNPPTGDHDNDGITDVVDIDDDNDGVPDLLEFCHPDEGWACLPGGLDPSGDEDGDGVQNYQDANDAAVNSGCTDANADGICDQIIGAYDTDGDNVPDHYDLDSDNDGISDLVEAGHNQADVDGNGVIDGDPAVFGANGFFSGLETNDSPTAVANYVPWDFDGDGIPDHDDLDSDNDGILDVVEAGYASSDTNQDGRIEGSANADGLVPLINPALTGQGIPLPPDWDGDGVPDWHDLDSDQDGVLDVVEAGYASSDTNQDGRIDDGNGNVPTVNSDGIPPVMNVNGNGQGIPLPIDWDSDGVPDWHDLDADQDGILDVVEAGYIDSDANQDGRIDDGNGNPPAVDANGIAPVINVNGNGQGIPLPIDWDSDGVPDWHDLDSDNDGILDVIEGGYQGSDTNLDGRIDDGNGNIPTVNVDGLPPVMTTGGPINLPPDTDSDGVRDWHDLDSDNDGINDTVENINPDGDNDGFIGTGPITVDVNGIATADANGPVVPNTPLVNTDGDGPGDFRDLDADGDGINDVIEGGLSDPDGDGIIGTGTPTVNGFGQATEGTTSNPPDTDGNGIPDFQQVEGEETCDTPATPVLAANATALCGGESLTLSTTAVTGANISYNWTFVGATGTTDFVTNVPTFTLDAVVGANSGAYTLIVTSDTCASAISNPIDVVVSPSSAAPVLTASESVVCEGASVTLSAGNAVANTTYEWTLTNADGNATVVATTDVPTLALTEITTNQAGTYTVVTSTGGGACPSGASNGVAVAVSPQPVTPVLSASATSVCEADPITLSATGTADANTTYEWTLTTADGNATVVATTDEPTLALPAVAADQTGTYTVVAIGGGGACPSGASNGVDISVLPRPDAPELTVDKDIHCEGERLEFMATPIAGATYTWTFTNPEGRVDSLGTRTRPSLVIENLVFTNTGNYQVVITLDGCSSLPSNDVAIDVASGGLPNVNPTSSAPIENPACEGTNVTLAVEDMADFTYEWVGPNGVVGTTAETIIIAAAPEDNGEYNVTITNPNGCSTTIGPVTVQVDPKPATPTISADPTTVCPGEGFTLSTDAVTGDNITYEWLLDGSSVGTTDNAELVINPATATDGGNYTVIINNGGCPSDPSDPIEITVQPPVEGDITMEPAGGVCEGETVTLTAPSAEGATYEWTGPNGFTSTDETVTLENVTAANNGDYAVTVTLNGCPNDFGPTTLAINPKPATPTASTDKDSACPGETVTLSTAEAAGDAISYDWLLNGEVVANTMDPTFSIEDFQEGNAGDYTVVVKDGSCPSDPSEAVPVSLRENLEGVTAASNSPVCVGDSINLMVTDVEGATFEWSGPNGFTSTEQNPVIAAATEADAGEYTVVVTIDGCPATIPPATVVVTPKPDAPTVSINEGPVCEGTAATITVAAPQDNTTYTVLDAAGATVATGITGIIEVPTDGATGDNTYTVIAQENAGCPSEPSNAVDLTVTPRPEEEATILTELMQDDCGGMVPTALEAAVPTEGTGMWTSSNMDVVFTDATSPVTDVMGLEDGDVITWTLSNEACGEYSTASLTISSPMPSETTATDDGFTILNTETVSGNVLGNDTPNNGSVTVISGPASGTGTIDANGNITYTPNDGFVGNDQFVYELCNTACPDAPCDQATVNITVNQDPSNLNCIVPDVISPNGDGLNDIFTIECADFKNVNLKIFNRWGDLVYEADNYNNNWDGQHDGADLPPGPYYYIFEETGAGAPAPTTGCVSIAR